MIYAILITHNKCIKRGLNMKYRIAYVVIAFTILLSGVNCNVARAQEVQSVETQEMPAEDNDVEQEKEEVYEGDDFIHLDQVTETDYTIEFAELRGEDSTWIFTDEKEYTLKLDEKDFLSEDHITVKWNISVKESGNALERGYQISEDFTSVTLNGEMLSQTILVSATIYDNGVETEYSCQTEVYVKEKYTELKTSLRNKQNLGGKWTYPQKLNVYIEDSSYPNGKKVALHVDEVTSSDKKIIGVSYNASKDKWSAEGKKVGKAMVTFHLSDGNNSYVLKKEIEVICNHEFTYDVVQVDRILTQAKSWLGFKESDGSHMKIVDVYNAYSPLPLNYIVQKKDAWCATYVSAVAIKLGYTYLIPVECGCGRMIERFEARGNWQEDESCTPEAGWVIFYDWQDSGKGENRGWSDHVGIVEKVSDGKITVIEGNYDDKVKRRTIDVNGRYIRGYGIPEYGKDVVRATTSKKGYITEGCTKCGDIKKTTIYPVTDITLDTDEFIYDGKTKELSVTVKNSKGKKVESGEYYLSGSVSKASPGKYSVKVNLDGKKYYGSETLSYVIYPSAPAKVNAFLNEGYDDVKVTWETCTGADGYNVYLKQGNATSYQKILSTKNNYCIKKDLADGKQYYFKVVPYFMDGSKKVESIRSKTANVYTMKKIQKPTIGKNTSNSIKIKWKDISGETGYQISKTIIRGKKKVCATTNKNETNLKVTKRVNYYYRVRAYKKVNGKTIYGPWSDAAAYKLK